MAYPGDLRIQVSVIVGVLQAPGRTLHVPGVTEGKENVFKAHSPGVTPLKAGELKVLEGTHEPEPMGLWGGRVGLKKPMKPPKKFPLAVSCFSLLSKLFNTVTI